MALKPMKKLFIPTYDAAVDEANRLYADGGVFIQIPEQGIWEDKVRSIIVVMPDFAYSIVKGGRG